MALVGARRHTPAPVGSGRQVPRQSGDPFRVKVVARATAEFARMTSDGDGNTDDEEDPADDIVGMDDHEAREKAAHKGNAVLRERMEEGRSLDPRELVEGELIVHKRVGVARIEGFEDAKSRKTGKKQRYARVRFQDGTARVPFAKASEVLYRYGADEDENVQFGRLKDTSAWRRKLAKAREGVQRQVASILEVHKERMQAHRATYPEPDPALREQFESKFPHELTDDQRNAIAEIESDMRSERPMDRLLVGDVGFGKTEVAARAAFRAVAAGRQVMMLAPTAVLAKQHHESLLERFKGFNVDVRLLSRNTKGAEAKEAKRLIAENKANLIVGTHALLSDSVDHSNLSFLIVDEEQRFGVRQKEKIKEHRRRVDVLTLTATPIPRTLQLSLKGLREASVLTTPPQGRRPIETWVGEFQQGIVCQAVKDEVERGGQALYVVPRISTLEEDGAPEELRNGLARIGMQCTIEIAHGRLPARQLEKAMDSFRAGNAEVLMATPIVENGLDIPTVNTLVVESAHKFGLSQMYQLRGRVGRSEAQARAYLTYPPGQPLSEQAKWRLQAIEECCELGDGFKIAQRDAEIRGGGSIFGTEQWGSSLGLGAELYTEILVSELARADRMDIPHVPIESVTVQLSGVFPSPKASVSRGGFPKAELERCASYVQSQASLGIDAINEAAEEISNRLGAVPEELHGTVRYWSLVTLAASLGFHTVREADESTQTSNGDTLLAVLETTMGKDTFKMVCQGLPKRLRRTVVYDPKQLNGVGIRYDPDTMSAPSGGHIADTLFVALTSMYRSLPAYAKL